MRLTALKRLPNLDLQAPNVQHTINLMVDRKIAIDPTLGIHEQLTQRPATARFPPGAVDYFDHMPIGWRRNAMKALADTSAPGDDQAYRQAFDKMIAVVRMLHDRGVFDRLRHRYGRLLHLPSRAGAVPARRHDERRDLEARDYSIRLVMSARISAWVPSKKENWRISF